MVALKPNERGSTNQMARVGLHLRLIHLARQDRILMAVNAKAQEDQRALKLHGQVRLREGAPRHGALRLS